MTFKRIAKRRRGAKPTPPTLDDEFTCMELTVAQATPALEILLAATAGDEKHPAFRFTDELRDQVTDCKAQHVRALEQHALDLAEWEDEQSMLGLRRARTEARHAKADAIEALGAEAGEWLARVWAGEVEADPERVLAAQALYIAGLSAA